LLDGGLLLEQALLLGHLIDRVTSWLMFMPLCGPWLLVYVISFCRVVLCGPGRFVQILIIAIPQPQLDDVSFELLRRSEQPTAVVHETICEQVHW
jgi:hypothetical protein